MDGRKFKGQTPAMYALPDLVLLLPTLLISLVANGVARFMRGGWHGHVLAGFGGGLGILAAMYALLGVPPFPPIAAGHKAFYAVVMMLVFGVVADLTKGREGLRRVVAMTLPMLTAYWLSYAQFLGNFFSFAALQFLVLTVAGGTAMMRLEGFMHRQLTSSIMVFAAAIGLGTVALIGGESTLSLVSFAVAAAVLGFVAWNWPIPRVPMSTPLLMACGAALSAAAGQLAYFSPAASWPLLALLPIFYVDRIRRKFIAGNDRIAQLLKPVVLAFLCGIPVGAAVALSWLAKA